MCEAEMLCQAPRERALPRRRRSVDGDDHERRDLGAEPVHEVDEAGKAGVDRRPVVDADRRRRRHAEDEKGHGDAMVELRRDGAAARRRHSSAVDGQAVAVGRDLSPAGGETADDGVEPIALLDAQLAEPVHHRAAVRGGGGDGKDRIFVDHARRALGRHLDAVQRAGAHRQIGDRLAAFVMLARDGDVRAHLAQRFDEPGCAAD